MMTWKVLSLKSPSLTKNFGVLLSVSLVSFLAKAKMEAVPKVTPPVLLCWSTTSEADVADVAVEMEPSHQCSITFYCRVTDSSRGAV